MLRATTFIFSCHSAQTAVALRHVIKRLQRFAQPPRNDWQTAVNPQQRGNNHVARSGFGHNSFTVFLHRARRDRHQLQPS